MDWNLKLTITRKGAEYGLKQSSIMGEAQYYLGVEGQHNITIGGTSSAMIWIPGSVPHQATLRFMPGKFEIQSYKKLTLEWQQKKQILTKGETIHMILSQEKNWQQECFLYIKDSSIQIQLYIDDGTLSNFPTWEKRLYMTYGSLVKIEQDSNTWLYQNLHNPTLIIRILKPNSSQDMINSFITGLKYLQEQNSQFQPKVLEIIQEPQIGLYAAILKFLPGNLLSQQIVLHKEIKKCLVICRNLLNFFHSVKNFFPLHPSSIWITAEGQIQIFKIPGFIGDQNFPLEWIAPEISPNRGDKIEQSNIFHLGMLWYTILVGIIPLEHASNLEFPHTHIHQNFFQIISLCWDLQSNRKVDFSSLALLWDNMMNSHEALIEELDDGAFDDTISHERPIDLFAEKTSVRTLTKDIFDPITSIASETKAKEAAPKIAKKTKELFITITKKDKSGTTSSKRILLKNEHIPTSPITNISTPKESLEQSKPIATSPVLQILPPNLNTDEQNIPSEKLSDTKARLDIVSAQHTNRNKVIDSSTQSTLSKLFHNLLASQRLIWISIPIMIVLLSIIIFFLLQQNFSYNQKKQWESLRQECLKNYQKLEMEYSKEIGNIPLYLDSQGLNDTIQETEKRILLEFRKTKKREHAISLASEILPAYRKILQLTQSIEDKKNLIHLLNTIISLYPNEEERRPYRLELLNLQGISTNSLDRPAQILLQVSPSSAQKYLFKYLEYPDGSQKIAPVDIKTGNIIEWPKEINKKILSNIDFLRAQNLLWEATMLLLNQNFLMAKNALLRCIEIHPEYLDAYFLLCCLHLQPGISKNVAGAFDFWQKRGLAIIENSNISTVEKNSLQEKFTTEFIQRISDIYSILPQRNYREKIDYLIQVAAISSKSSVLQPQDYILMIDDIPVTSLESLHIAIRNKSSITCKILRNWEIMQANINTSEYNDNDFHAIEVVPIFYIYLNQPLDFQNQRFPYNIQENLISKIFTSKNQIIDDSIALMPGSYLLVITSENYFSVNYPFIVSRESISESNELLFGEPYAEPILINLPRYPKNCEKVLKNFAIIPRGFLKTFQSECQNNTGYLLGINEVTIGQWYEYLKNINGPLPWKIEKIANRIPMVSANKSLFYLRGEDLVLRFGNMNYPVFGISYNQVQEYIQWLNQNLPIELKNCQFKFRLPTAEEWACATSGADRRLFPWGNFANPRFCKSSNSRPYWSELEPIHQWNISFSLDESPFGIHDLAGNITEYTSTQKVFGNLIFYAIKGSSWNDPIPLDAEYTTYIAPNLQRNNRGFRLCAGLDPLYETED